jgi:hypothetical protein
MNHDDRCLGEYESIELYQTPNEGSEPPLSPDCAAVSQRIFLGLSFEALTLLGFPAATTDAEEIR